MEKQEIYSHQKIFREINYLETSLEKRYFHKLFDIKCESKFVQFSYCDGLTILRGMDF